ncbi:uncharacterized protein LOC118274239 isoform X2 [Spodoptera frugiperda]|uniref:Uncharacterized protein LOC118274239 isoform X2 n=1 Tax=Spodoptera frugiperda TaxID=7108 RepID=A0A9R0DC13_SPOFR|nr:uncharacterized protein LOC118274239 isoform X2 [Spodoptera frugiperda]
MKYIGRMLPINYVTIDPNLYEPTSVRVRPQSPESEENPHEKVIGLREPYEERDSEEYFDYDRPQSTDTTSKPCAVVVLSNMQNPNMQSLLRKYRYDANGVLIPSSVKYFIKLPQGLRASPVLVPLNDKAFSPLGGFVRYYKEVPPIPHAW